MIAFYLFIILPAGFILWRLVQLFLLAEQFKREGRDIQKEIDRLAGMRLEKK